MNTIQAQNQQAQELAEALRSQKKQKEELQASHEREMENLKSAYAAEKAESVDRFETSAQNDRLLHYENLRALKNRIQNEERDLESRGRESIANKTLRLQKEDTLAEQEGRNRVENTLKKYAALEEYERQATRQASEEARDLRTRSMHGIVESTEAGIENLRQEKGAYLEGRKQTHSEALQGIDAHYRGIRGDLETRHREELNALEEKSFLALNQKRLDQARVFSLQEERKSDPFYQLQRFESAVSDEGSRYRLQVKAPLHERKNLKIQAQGQDVHVIGVRVSDEEAYEQGRTISSRTHQTLSEKIRLDAPIDPRSITRHETENGVEFLIPKYGTSPGSDASGRESGDLNSQKTAKQIRFSESLPSPSFVSPKSGKGTMG